MFLCPSRGRRAVSLTVVGFLAALGASIIGPVHAQNFSIVDLGVLPGANISHGEGLNDVGGVAGDSNPSSVPTAAIWQNGVIQSLGALTGFSVAFDINNAGQVVGPSPGNGGFLYQNGSVLFLPALPGASGPGGLTDAYNINNAGIIAGTSRSPSGLRAVLWDNGMAPLNLGVLPGASESEARDVNDVGQATGFSGQSAFLWQNGVMNDLGKQQGSNNAIGMAINNLGHVVGYNVFTTPSSINRAFVWRNGIMSSLGLPPGTTSSSAVGINDADQIVGTISLPNSVEPVLWQNGGVFLLNSLLPANSGWVLQNATAINNRGQIVGTGSFNGQVRAYLLTLASPEPSTATLLLPLGAPLILWRRRFLTSR